MADDDDLPDWDYESIYGREARMARLLARLVALEKKLAEQAQGSWRLSTDDGGSPQNRRR